MWRTLVLFVCVTAFVGVVCFGVVLAIYPLRYRQEISAAASTFDIEADLIASVIKAESGFRPDMISSKGAVGLMQLMPATAVWMAERMGIELDLADLAEPSLNITIGTAYFRYLLDKFVDLRTALYAYNAGEGKVARWLQTELTIIQDDGVKTLATSPYPSSNAYVEKVLRARVFYKIRV
jgi:soluble lytic murein transglycosylase